MRRVWHGMLMALAAGAAGAQAVSEGPQARVALLAGWAEPDGQRVAGLSVALKPGWKTYWRSPGEAGLPPVLDWSGSSNIADLVVAWPAPEVIDAYGMTTLVYGGSVVLPVKVTPSDPSAPVTLALAMEFGVCAEVCLPASAALSLEIAPGAPAQDAGPIRAAMARVPVPAAAAGVSEAACGVRGAGVDRHFEARLRMAPMPEAMPLMVVEGPPEAWFGPVETQAEGGLLTASGPVQVYGEGVWIGRDALRLTLLWPDRAVEVQGCGPL